MSTGLPISWPEGLWQRPSDRPEAPILLLFHGLGARWEDMSSLGEALDPGGEYHLLCLNAPRRPVTLNRGYVMPAWYDLLGLSQDSGEDTVGLAEMGARLSADVLPWGGKRAWILGGFSQGAALSLYMRLHAGFPAAALLLFSGYLPLRKHTPPATGGMPPIFWGHGSEDEILPWNWATLGTRILAEQGYVTQLKQYPMAHQVCAAEIQDARAFLQDINAQISVR